MKITKHNESNNNLISLSDYLNSFFYDDFFDNTFTLYPMFKIKKWNPSSSVEEEKNEYIVKAELPGVNEKDLKVTVDDRVLTVKAEYKDEVNEKDKEKKEYTEKSYGSFTRSFRLPENVDIDKIEAKYKNGLLKVSLPKIKVEEKKEREIKISA